MANEMDAFNTFMTTIAPTLKILSITVISAAVLIGLGYWFFIIRGRKKWFINIYEQRTDGRLHLVDRDKILEKRMDYGRRVIYWAQKHKQEVTPPPWESTEHIGNKDIADYVRIRRSLVPIKKQVDANQDITTPTGRFFLTQYIDRAINAMHKKYDYNAERIKHRYILVPAIKVPHIKIGYMQMDYDVDMMRINQIDNIDLMFADKKNFWEKYGNMIAIGIIALLVIVVCYMSFEYLKSVVQSSLGAAQQVSTALEKVANSFTGSQPKPPV